MFIFSPARSRALVAAVALFVALAPTVHAAPGVVDLSVSLVGAPNPVVPGKLLTYRISVDARGNRDASSVSMQTAVPVGTAFVRVDVPQGWTVAAPEPDGVGNVTATIPSLAVGRRAVLQVTVRVGAETPINTIIASLATVASSTTDPTPEDNTASESTAVRSPRPPLADLVTDVDLLQEPVVTSGNMVTMVTVRNAGPQTATDVVIHTSTPDETTFAWAAATHGTVTAPEVDATGDITCAIDALPNGKEVVLTVVTRVTAPANGRVETGAAVTASSMDPNMANNVGRTSSRVIPPVSTTDLAIEIADLADHVPTNSDVTYRVVARNDGSERADGVTVLAPIPPGTRFISAAPDQGPIRIPPPGRLGAVGWRPGMLEAGASVSLSITVRVGARSGVPLRASALGTSVASDANSANNLAFATTRVQTIGLALVQWTPPDLASGELTPPPTEVVVDPTAGSAPKAAQKTSSPRDDAEPPVEYNVYVSSSPNVSTTPENLWTTVPANETTATVPVAPGGSFFTVTATYPDGESSTSNADGTGDQAGATLTSVKVKSTKITGKGTGFTDVVEMYLDGIPFADPATVKGSNSKTIQKGALAIGMTVEQYTATGGTFLIIFRNSDGGVTIWEYEP